MSLSIIIVNYKSEAYIQQCIQSACKYPSAAQFEWIIVDNDSKNEAAKQQLLQAFPFVTWIDMGYNAGFARANNKGIAAAKHHYILLLNPDTIIINDALDACLRFYQQHPTYSAVGVQLLYANHSYQISGSKFMVGGINHLLPLPYWGKCLKMLASMIGASKPGVTHAQAITQVDWISGAFLMTNKKVIQQAGLMDEMFFLYAEEVEWCYRLGKYGKLAIVGDIEMIHIVGESITAATQSATNSYDNIFDKKGLQLIVSNHLRIYKQYGLFWFLFQLFNFTLAIPFGFVCAFLHSVLSFKIQKRAFANLFGLTWNVCKLWLLAPSIVFKTKSFYKLL